MNNSNEFLEGTAGPYRDVVDYILGITHEIWESRQVERIHAYYDAATPIYALGGFVNSAVTIVQNTWDTLAAFPDRLLLGEAVVWSRESAGCFYSSHRILSPMTNSGPSQFGSATGRAVLVRTIADCVVQNGVITREWLVRDNYGLVRQLGFDPIIIAKEQAAKPMTPDHMAWVRSETTRVGKSSRPMRRAPVSFSEGQIAEFAQSVLSNVWLEGDPVAMKAHYASYAVLHDSQPVASGSAAISAHYDELRRSFADGALTVDHICTTQGSDGLVEVAARWTFAAIHSNAIWGGPATGAQLLILGVTHWRIVAGKIAVEWTIYDRLAVLAQILRSAATRSTQE